MVVFGISTSTRYLDLLLANQCRVPPDFCVTNLRTQSTSLAQFHGL